MLKKNQERAYNLLHSFQYDDKTDSKTSYREQSSHPSPSFPDDIVTAIISTLIHDTGIASSIFLVKGLVIDLNLSKDMSRLDLKDSPGWFATTHWFASPFMAKQLDEKWRVVTNTIRTIHPDDHKSLSPFGRIEMDAANESQQLVIVVPSADSFSTEGDAEIISNHLKLSHFARGRQIDRKRYQLQLSTNGENFTGTIPPKPQRYRFAEFQYLNHEDVHHSSTVLEAAPGKFSTSLQLPSDDPCVESSLSVHHIQTKVLRKPKGDLQLVSPPRAVAFAVAAKGQFPNVALPEVNYHDPMTIWNSKTSKAGASLAEMVDQKWKTDLEKSKECGEKEKKSFIGNMAQFSVFVKNEPSKSFEPLDMSMWVNAVRKSKSGSKSADLFDIWSHNQRINGLHCQILETEDGPMALDDLLAHYDNIPATNRDQLMRDSTIATFVRKFDLDDPNQLPISFKYPTIQVKNMALPLLNQLGVDIDYNNNQSEPIKGCLVREQDNRAHLKAMRAGDAARTFIPDTDIPELIEYHRDYKNLK